MLSIYDGVLFGDRCTQVRQGEQHTMQQTQGHYIWHKIHMLGNDNLSLGMVIGITVSGEITVFSYFVVSVGIHS